MLARVLWITAISASLAACGDDGGDGSTTTTGGGGFDNASLTVVEPADGAVGLAFGEATTLRVRYLDSDGVPIGNAPVAFDFLVGTGEETGGATLSATSASTDDRGETGIELVAGAQIVNFRVTASAEAASPATFFVAVSDQGFVTFEVDIDYLGAREDLQSLELRLYQRDQATCADIDPRDPPGTQFPRRFSSDFDEPIQVPFVIALRAYSLAVVASTDRDGTPLAGGCINLGADQVLVGRPIQLGVPVIDLALLLTDALNLVTTLDTGPVANYGRSRGAEDLWDVLACPAGPGQLLLDCAIDALATSEADPSDCRVETETAEVLALQGARGPLGDDGCRATDDGGGAATLDQQLTGAVAAGAAFPTGSALSTLLDTRARVQAGAILRSVFRADGPNLARHRIAELAFVGPVQTALVDLQNSARPVVEARQVPLALSTTDASIGEHQFTLRFGDAQFQAFDALALQPVGLEMGPDRLAAALVASVSEAGAVGCEAVSDLACSAAGLAATCLLQACADGVLAGDEGLAAWTRILDGSGLDFALSGTADVIDAEPDLIIDGLGDLNESTGQWAATLSTDDGMQIAIPATFATAQ